MPAWKPGCADLERARDRVEALARPRRNIGGGARLDWEPKRALDTVSHCLEVAGDGCRPYWQLLPLRSDPLAAARVGRRAIITPGRWDSVPEIVTKTIRDAGGLPTLLAMPAACSC